MFTESGSRDDLEPHLVANQVSFRTGDRSQPDSSELRSLLDSTTDLIFELELR